MTGPAALRILAAAILPALLAGALVWRATANGPAFTPDGRLYLDAAQSFAATGGLWVHDGCGVPRWMNMVPPLFPAVTGLGIAAGFEPFAFVRFSNALLAALSAALIALAALRLSGSILSGAAAGIALALLPDFVDSHRRFLSEPLFYTLLFGGFVLLESGIGKRCGTRLAAAGLCFGLAAATRFAGAPFLPAGAALCWLFTRRIRLAAAFLAFAAIPPVTVAVLNAHFAGGNSDRVLAFNPLGWEYFRQALEVTAGWFRLGTAHPALQTAVVLGAILLIAVLPLRRAAGSLLALALAAGYLLFLLITRLWFDAGVDLLPRYMIPVFGLLLVAITGAAPRRLLTVALLSFAVIHLPEALRRPQPQLARYDSNHTAWRKSEPLRYLASLPSIRCRFGSRPDPIHRHTGKPAGWLPRKLSGYTAGGQADWCAELRKDLETRRPAAFAFFDVYPPGENAQVSETELRECLPDAERTRLSGGTVFVVR